MKKLWELIIISKMSSNDLHKTVMGFRDPIYKNCIHANNLEISNFPQTETTSYSLLWKTVSIFLHCVQSIKSWFAYLVLIESEEHIIWKENVLLLLLFLFLHISYCSLWDHKYIKVRIWGWNIRLAESHHSKHHMLH